MKGEWVLMAMAPVFLGFVAWEAWHWHRRGRDIYTLRDTLGNAALALMHQAADALAWLLANPGGDMDLLTLSGRGDKDLAEVLRILGVEDESK